MLFPGLKCPSCSRERGREVEEGRRERKRKREREREREWEEMRERGESRAVTGRREAGSGLEGEDEPLCESYWEFLLRTSGPHQTRGF